MKLELHKDVNTTDFYGHEIVTHRDIKYIAVDDSGFLIGFESEPCYSKDFACWNVWDRIHYDIRFVLPPDFDVANSLKKVE